MINRTVANGVFIVLVGLLVASFAWSFIRPEYEVPAALYVLIGALISANEVAARRNSNSSNGSGSTGSNASSNGGEST